LIASALRPAEIDESPTMGSHGKAALTETGQGWLMEGILSEGQLRQVELRSDIY